MTEAEAIAYFDSYYHVVTEPGLHRMRELLARLGDPQKKLKCLHVAGTNGKGSTCAMLESILRTAGYKTGLYISPHILRFNERMSCDGKPIAEEELGAVTALVKAAAESMSEQCNEFELITAAAFLFFARQQCDIAVLEVGLGGEFDSTNIIPAPECALIMNIGMDHMDRLGNTLREIAAVKAGIIKPDGDAVYYRNLREVEAAFEAQAQRVGARLYAADFESIRVHRSDIFGQVFDCAGFENLHTPLIGAHQLRNAAVVLECVRVLRSRGWRISDEAVYRGIEEVYWPVRFELVDRDPLFIIDGGHNSQCLKAITESLNTLLPGRRVVFLTGVLADKDVDEMAKILDVEAGAEYVTLTPDSPRAMSAEKLAEYLSREQHIAAEPCADIPSGIERAKELAGRDGVVCCIGSLYLAGEVRKYFPRNPKLK